MGSSFFWLLDKNAEIQIMVPSCTHFMDRSSSLEHNMLLILIQEFPSAPPTCMDVWQWMMNLLS
jgi:hypothetical protein